MTNQGWTKTPNIILESVSDMCEVEIKLTFAIVRQTFGYHRNEARMTYEDMMSQAGLSRGSVYTAIQLIEKRGFFIRGNRSRWIVNSTKFVLFDKPESENSTNSIPQNLNDSTNPELSDDQKSTKSELYESTKSELFQYSKEREEKKRNTPPSPPPDEIQESWQEVERLMAFFEKITHRKRPYARTGNGKAAYLEKWIAPLHDMKELANGQTEAILRQAVNEMVKKDLSISAPSSVLTVFTDIFRKQQGARLEPERIGGAY